MRPPPASPAGPTPPGGVSPGELLLAGGFAAAVAAGAVLWATGQVAGLVSGGRWPPVGAGEMASVLLRLPGNVGDPARAWPPAARELLPGPLGFYAVLLCLGLLLLALAFALVGAWKRAGERGLSMRRLRRRRHGVEGLPPRRRRTERSARWARVVDVRRLLVAGAEPGRVTLGRVSGRLVAGEPRQSVIVVAPTQTYKTSGFAVPALVEWRGPAVVTSIKTDLVRDSMDARCGAGEVRIFDPIRSSGLRRSSWTPLAQCASWEGARRCAYRLIQASQVARGAGADGDFWARQGSRYLAPLLFAAQRAKVTMREVVRWVNAGKQDEVRAALGAADGVVADGEDADACRAALEVLESVWGAEERLRSSLLATVAGAIDAYSDTAVLECSVDSEITAEWLLAGHNTLYLCAPADEQERLAPLFVALIAEIRAEVYRRAAASGQPVDPALLLMLDEAANVAPVPDLDVLASTGAGQGLQLVTIVQDLAQVHRRWQAAAETVVNNHTAKIVGSGIACPRTLEYVARLLGDEELRQVSISSQGGGFGERSRTESSTWRAIAPANVLREAEPGTGLLVYRSLAPARVELRPWFAEPRLRELVEGPPAVGERSEARPSERIRVPAGRRER